MRYTFEKNYLSKTDSKFSMHYNRLGENADITAIPHWHEGIEILYVKKGELNCKTDYTEISAGEGSIIYINSYVTHHLKNLTPMCEYLCLISDISLISKYNFLLGSTSVYTTDSEHIISLIKTIENEFLKKPLNYTIVIEGLLISVLTYINRNSTHTSTFMSNVQFNKIRLAISYINEHLSENITIKDISSYIGFSESHFSRCFHSVTKMSVITYVNLVRCKHAYYLLSEMDKSVKDAAEMSGFTNMSYFTKRFKEIYNILPSELSKQSSTVKSHT